MFQKIYGIDAHTSKPVNTKRLKPALAGIKERENQMTEKRKGFKIRAVAVLLIAVMVISMAGCGGMKTSEEKTSISVYLWGTGILDQNARYIQSQFPDLELEFEGVEPMLIPYYSQDGEGWLLTYPAFQIADPEDYITVK